MATRLEKLRGLSTRQTIDQVFLKNLDLGMEGNVERNPYKFSDLVYICISTTARAIAQVPIIITKPKNKRERERVDRDHPWQKLFKKPNTYMDAYSFTESIVSFLMLDGDSFIVPFPPKGNPPDALWVVRKKYMRPVREKGGHLGGWAYNPTGNFPSDPLQYIPQGAFPLDVEDVVHMWFFNPDDPIMGMAPLDAGKMNIVVDYKAAKYNQLFFERGATPGGVLYTDYKLNDRQYNRIKEQFLQEVGGYKKSHSLAVLEQGLKYAPMGLTQKDMEFVRYREFNMERTFQIFGMKKSVVSVTSDVNYSTAAEERKEWWQNTNTPIVNLIASAINFSLLEKQNLEASYDLTTVPILQESMKDKLESARILSNMGFTANEINERLGLGFGEKWWREKWYMPVNVMPVDEFEPPKPPDDSDNPPELPEEEVLLIGNGKGTEDPVHSLTWHRLIALATPFENNFTSKTSRIFLDMRKKTLDLLFKGIRSVDDVDKETYSDELARMERYLSPIFIQTILDGAADFSSEVGIGISFDLNDPVAVEFIARKKITIRGIVNTVKEQIRHQIRLSMESGESTAQTAERIRNVFNVAKGRAKTIARTEVGGALNFARNESINRSGFREKKWFTALDERVRIDHKDMHGLIVQVGQPWVLPDGSSLRYPGDPLGTARQIINCRCIEVVVVRRT